MTTLERKQTALAKAEKMTLQELMSAKEANQKRFNGGGDLEDYLIANDVLNYSLNKLNNKNR